MQSWRYNWLIWALFIKKKWCMRLEWNQRQNFFKILICLNINFQKQILKGQLRINLWKSRILDHNNLFQWCCFLILKSNLVLFHSFHFVCHPFFEYLFICLSNISLKLFLVVTFNSICAVLFFKLICFLL